MSINSISLFTYIKTEEKKLLPKQSQKERKTKYYINIFSCEKRKKRMLRRYKALCCLTSSYGLQQGHLTTLAQTKHHVKQAATKYIKFKGECLSLFYQN